MAPARKRCRHPSGYRELRGVQHQSEGYCYIRAGRGTAGRENAVGGELSGFVRDILRA